VTENKYRIRVKALQSLMAENNIDVYIIVTDDFHGSEYVGDYFKAREYISGFDGSAGTLVITREEAGLWTDGRYFIQAAAQLEGTGIRLYKTGNEGVPSIPDYLEENMKPGSCLAYDGRTINAAYGDKIKSKLKDKAIRYIEDIDLPGKLWQDRPKLPAFPVWILEDCYTGQSRTDKLRAVRKSMEEAKADCHLLTALDDIAWLYNIRGNDIAYCPMALAYSIVTRERAILYIDEAAVSDVRAILENDEIELKPYFDIYKDIKELGTEGINSILLDKKTVNIALVSALPDNIKILDKINPTTIMKAEKNKTEMDNEEAAHIKDGVAVTRLIYWLKTRSEVSDITELDVCNKLEELRKQGEDYLGQSFAPISASGAHGAVVHYEPTEKTNIPLVNNSFLLLDTGGHYLQGTTDITRTIVIGKVNDIQKQHYTAVLRGNLNLAAAVFKAGTGGTNLDILARQPLWELGLDYNHGTGHGVGYLLNVHEGPNAFRQHEADNTCGVPLKEGMITSDEPGVYLEGEYGIRLENMILCKKGKKTELGQYYYFKTLTLVPFDKAAIAAEFLSDRELELLNSYHKKVWDSISPYLNTDEQKWLKEATAPIE
jgi:Xaa-Pro aminopeptidase